MRPLEDQVALVTGASHPRGIGSAIARKLASQGATLVITDLAHTLEQLSAVAAELESTGSTVMTKVVDVTSPEAVGQCVGDVIDRFGRLDILVNNAGVGGGEGEFLKVRKQDFDLAYQVNVVGVANLCQAALPYMLKQGSGTIVNVASLCGLGAIPDIPVSYTASKFAAVGLTKAIALEYAASGIRCNAVCPGVVNTDMRDQLMQRLAEQYEITPDEAERREDETIAIGRGAEASEVADAVAYLAGPAATYLTGVALPVAGGMAPGL
jgi:3-oxoacyl-[acyl-carrier protein] reductase